MNYEKLKKDLLNKADISGSMLLVDSVDNADEIELLRLAKKHNLDISAY
ncbi:hypothetical protein LGK95_15880 [Clostridium algoriphilum]|nr:hypothetical protein [Clostridium algoriphilum]MCB2294966.1 hypothetical protein [Clostridium algoriphilum]